MEGGEICSLKSCTQSCGNVISITLAFLSKSLASSLLTASAAVCGSLLLSADNLLGCLFISRVHLLLGKQGNIKMVNRKTFCRCPNKQKVYILVRNVHGRIEPSVSHQPWLEKQHTGLCQWAVPGYWSVHSELSNTFWEM